MCIRDRYKAVKKALLPTGIKLEDFANGDLYYGFHRTEKGWIYREWAPNATAMHLIGDFNKWNRESHPMQRLEDVYKRQILSNAKWSRISSLAGQSWRMSSSVLIRTWSYWRTRCV